MNKVILIGNLTDKPEDKGSFYTFTVATNKNYQKDGEWKSIAQFHNCIKNKNYDLHFDKGDLVSVEGEITYKKAESGRFTNINVQSIKKLVKTDNPDIAKNTSTETNNEFDSDVPF